MIGKSGPPVVPTPPPSTRSQGSLLRRGASGPWKKDRPSPSIAHTRRYPSHRPNANSRTANVAMPLPRTVVDPAPDNSARLPTTFELTALLNGAALTAEPLCHPAGGESPHNS